MFLIAHDTLNLDQVSRKNNVDCGEQKKQTFPCSPLYSLTFARSPNLIGKISADRALEISGVMITWFPAFNSIGPPVEL